MSLYKYGTLRYSRRLSMRKERDTIKTGGVEKIQQKDNNRYKDITDKELQAFGLDIDGFSALTTTDQEYVYNLMKHAPKWTPVMSTMEARMYSTIRTNSSLIIPCFHGTTANKARNIEQYGFHNRYNSPNANFFSYTPGYSCMFGNVVLVCYLCLKNPMPTEEFNQIQENSQLSHEERSEQLRAFAVQGQYDGYYNDRDIPDAFAFVWDPEAIVIVGKFIPEIPCELSDRTLNEMKME